MGHSLNLHLIAEDAEEPHHYQFLKDYGCHEVQGYYFSRPLSEENFINYLQGYSEKKTGS